MNAVLLKVKEWFLQKVYKEIGMNRHLVDVFRIVGSISVATFVLVASKGEMFTLPDEALAPLMTSSALVVYLATFSHITRRILFPSIDMRVYYKKAAEEPLGASIVFAAVVYMMSVLIQAGTALLR